MPAAGRAECPADTTSVAHKRARRKPISDLSIDGGGLLAPGNSLNFAVLREAKGEEVKRRWVRLTKLTHYAIFVASNPALLIHFQQHQSATLQLHIALFRTHHGTLSAA